MLFLRGSAGQGRAEHCAVYGDGRSRVGGRGRDEQATNAVATSRCRLSHWRRSRGKRSAAERQGGEVRVDDAIALNRGGPGVDGGYGGCNAGVAGTGGVGGEVGRTVLRDDEVLDHIAAARAAGEQRIVDGEINGLPAFPAVTNFQPLSAAVLPTKSSASVLFLK